MQKKVLVRIFSLAVSLGLIFLMMKYLDFKAIRSYYNRSSSLDLISVLALLITGYTLRGIRVWLILPFANNKKLGVCVAISYIHNFCNHIFPLRTGELVFPFLLKKYLDQSLVDASIKLLKIRIYDLISVVVLTSCALVYMYSSSLLLGLVIGILMLLASILLFEHLQNSTVSTWLKERLSAYIPVKNLYSPSSTRFHSWQIATVSILLWVMTYAMFAKVLQIVGIEFQLHESILSTTGAVLSSFIPANGIGSFGVLEFGWASGLMWFGRELEESISSGLFMHLLVIVVGGVLSFFAVIYLWTFNSRINSLIE